MVSFYEYRYWQTWTRLSVFRYRPGSSVLRMRMDLETGKLVSTKAPPALAFPSRHSYIDQVCLASIPHINEGKPLSLVVHPKTTRQLYNGARELASIHSSDFRQRK